jgi:hypothetical protein
MRITREPLLATSDWKLGAAGTVGQRAISASMAASMATAVVEPVDSVRHPFSMVQKVDVAASSTDVPFDG